jgi:hypothetical protein
VQNRGQRVIRGALTEIRDLMILVVHFGHHPFGATDVRCSPLYIPSRGSISYRRSNAIIKRELLKFTSAGARIEQVGHREIGHQSAEVPGVELPYAAVRDRANCAAGRRITVSSQKLSYRRFSFSFLVKWQNRVVEEKGDWHRDA